MALKKTMLLSAYQLKILMNCFVNLLSDLSFLKMLTYIYKIEKEKVLKLFKRLDNLNTANPRTDKKR